MIHLSSIKRLKPGYYWMRQTASNGAKHIQIVEITYWDRDVKEDAEGQISMFDAYVKRIGDDRDSKLMDYLHVDVELYPIITPAEIL